MFYTARLFNMFSKSPIVLLQLGVVNWFLFLASRRAEWQEMARLLTNGVTAPRGIRRFRGANQLPGSSWHPSIKRARSGSTVG